MTREETLTAAKKCVCQDRNDQYGSPEDSFAIIAKYWNAYLNPSDVFGKDFISASDVGIMMALMKIARIQNGQFKEDSYVDACGYMACAAEIASSKDDETINFEKDN